IIVRQQMGTAQVVELDAMLEGSEEAIGQGKPFAVVAANIAVVDQGLQCRQGGARPEPLVHPAVYQLQELDRELDIPQATLTELELATLITRRNVRHHSFAHRL